MDKHGVRAGPEPMAQGSHRRPRRRTRQLRRRLARAAELAQPSAAAAETAAPAIEIELKLSIGAEDARRLGRLPSIRLSSRGRARTRRLHSVYYDTPTFELRRDGVALRLRRDGKRWIQTLKGAGEVQGGLHLRQEQDTPVPAQILNYPALAASGASPVLSDPALRAQLYPVFTTDFRRTSRNLELVPGTHVELCVDSGQVTAGSTGAPDQRDRAGAQAGAARKRCSHLAHVLLDDIAAAPGTRQQGPARVRARVRGSRDAGQGGGRRCWRRG